jgi:eukaryotic-like serine/threonine-protein kinase
MSDQPVSETQRCPQCDAEFSPATSPLGVCPACLLRLGASNPAMKAVPTEPEFVSSEVRAASATPNRTVWRRRFARIGAAAIVVAALAVVLLVMRSTSSAPPALSPVIRFNLPWPDETASVEDAQFAVAPDGSRIALAARSSEGQTRLWVRTLQSMEWRALPRTEGAALPFWSPDSRQIGFFAEKKLKTIDVSNGLTHTLCDAPSGRGGTWGGQNTIVFAPSAGGPLLRVQASGGTPQPVTTLDQSAGETAHAWPHFLPDDRSVLFVATATGAGLHIASLDSGERKLVVGGGGAGAFAQGYLLFVRGTQLLAQRFNPQRGEFEDDQRPISGAELVGDSRRGSGFTVSNAGVLVHRVGGSIPSQLTWLDRNGRDLGVTADPADYQQFSISPDGRRIAVARRDARDSTSNIWLIEPERQVASRLTLGSHDSSPLWLPDGNRIAFVSLRDGKRAVYATDANGGKEQLLHSSPELKHLETVSPDGRFLVYATTSVRTGLDLWLLPTEGDLKPQPLLQTAFNESEGRLSPDGRWIAYVSDESGRDEVYVRPFPQPDSRRQISTAGGQRPRWRSDGRELFFQSPDGRLLAVAVDAQAGLPIRSGAPHILFQMRQADEYEVARDGQRFLTKTRLEDHDRNGLQVILHWAEELRREPGPR